MSYTDKQINQMFDYLKLSNDVFKLNQRLSEHRRLYLNQPQDNHDDNNNDQNSENSSKHMNTIPDTDEELTFKPRKVKDHTTVKVLDSKHPCPIALEDWDGSSFNYTAEEARDLANALFSASNFLRSQR